jgi:hypothetical protein
MPNAGRVMLDELSKLDVPMAVKVVVFKGLMHDRTLSSGRSRSSST